MIDTKIDLFFLAFALSLLCSCFAALIEALQSNAGVDLVLVQVPREVISHDVLL